ncbi:MAG: hypothetical protein ACPGQV_06355 [Alphaproteobacteria bacterium]
MGIGGDVLGTGRTTRASGYPEFCVGGLVAGTVAIYSHWLPIFFAFDLLNMLPIAIQILAGDRDIDKLMGVLLIVYTVSLIFLAVNFVRALRQSMSLRETLGDVEQFMESIFIHLPFPVAVKIAGELIYFRECKVCGAT